MKNKQIFVKVVLSLVVATWAATCVYAFPPAPDHIIKGTVRDEMGYPLEVEGLVLLKTLTEVVIQTPIMPTLYADGNYRMEVPMDAGVTPDSYTPTALNPLVPFTMEIRIGSNTYYPFEMSGDYKTLGMPGETTVIDLTLGVDSDGDGMPDAWEYALMSRTDRYNSLADITPEGDLDGDGLSNYQEYLANTYAYDVLEGLTLQIVEVTDTHCVIQFLTINGHNYTVYGSSDMKEWGQKSFKLSTDFEGEALRSSYDAADVEVVEVWIQRTPGDTGPGFYRLDVN